MTITKFLDIFVYIPLRKTQFPQTMEGKKKSRERFADNASGIEFAFRKKYDQLERESEASSRRHSKKLRRAVDERDEFNWENSKELRSSNQAMEAALESANAELAQVNAALLLSEMDKAQALLKVQNFELEKQGRVEQADLQEEQNKEIFQDHNEKVFQFKIKLQKARDAKMKKFQVIEAQWERQDAKLRREMVSTLQVSGRSGDDGAVNLKANAKAAFDAGRRAKKCAEDEAISLAEIDVDVASSLKKQREMPFSSLAIHNNSFLEIASDKKKKKVASIDFWNERAQYWAERVDFWDRISVCNGQMNPSEASLSVSSEEEEESFSPISSSDDESS